MDSTKLAHTLTPSCPLPDDFIAEALPSKDRIQQQLQVMRRRWVAMEIEAAGGLEDAMEFDEARGHHREVSHHGGVFEEAVEGFHHLRHGDVRAGVNELVVKLGGVGPAPGVAEGMELRLAGLAGLFAEEDVVVGVGIERRVEVFEVNAVVGEFPGVAQPTEVVAEE